MDIQSTKAQRSLEIGLIIVAVGLVALLYQAAGARLVVLNLFYLPVVLAAFFLGRYRAGVLALFSVVGVLVVASLELGEFTAPGSPLAIGLSLLVWAGVLGLTALLVGTLSDERSAKLVELHEAYVGVVEVLSRYLQSANPKLKARSNRVAELSQRVAVEMRLSPREVDDIRVAALLHDMENIEITARVLKKAVGDLEGTSREDEQHTFHGTELVHSLGRVLTGAFPLILNLNDDPTYELTDPGTARTGDPPFGARIIRTVREFDRLLHGDLGELGASPREVISELRHDAAANHHPAVLHALQRVVIREMFDRATEAQSAPAAEARELVEAGAAD
jgi:HD domain